MNSLQQVIFTSITPGRSPLSIYTMKVVCKLRLVICQSFCLCVCRLSVRLPAWNTHLRVKFILDIYGYSETMQKNNGTRFGDVSDHRLDKAFFSFMVSKYITFNKITYKRKVDFHCGSNMIQGMIGTMCRVNFWMQNAFSFLRNNPGKHINGYNKQLLKSLLHSGSPHEYMILSWWGPHVL